MSLENTIDVLKTIAKAVKDSTVITDKLGITEIFDLLNRRASNNITNTNIYSEDKNSYKENTESVTNEDIKPYNSLSNDYYNRKLDTSSNPQGFIDSITQEITPIKLQQAIILSEIVGKPRSKTRKRF